MQTLRGRWSRAATRAAIAVVVLTALSAPAETHTVTFGTGGFTYTPDQFTAVVGDTVVWEGNFLVHPLSSTSVPDGAEAFSSNSGTAFEYVITVPGSYEYECLVHGTTGMTGLFTADAAAVAPRTVSRQRVVPTGHQTAVIHDLTGRRLGAADGPNRRSGVAIGVTANGLAGRIVSVR